MPASESVTLARLCAMIDHTNLKADAVRADFERLCAEAAEHGFAAVAVNPARVAYCAGRLQGTGVRVAACCSFPLGQTTPAEKRAEAEACIADGAGEIDYVINVGALKDGDDALVREEMRALAALSRGSGVLLKAIFETCYLTDAEIARAAAIARDERPDFVKTSTGFGPAGARVGHVRLMKEAAGPAVQVKAAGGVRTWQDCAAMLDAGATRVGTSAALVIIDQFRKGVFST